MPSTLGIVASHTNQPIFTITPSKLYAVPGDTITWNVNVTDISNGTFYTSFLPQTNGTIADDWSILPPTSFNIVGGVGSFAGTFNSQTADTISNNATLQLRDGSTSGRILATSPTVQRYIISTAGSPSNRVQSATNNGVGTGTFFNGAVPDGRTHRLRINVTILTGQNLTLVLRLNNSTGSIILNEYIPNGGGTTTSRIYNRYLRIPSTVTGIWYSISGANTGFADVIVAAQSNADFALTS